MNFFEKKKFFRVKSTQFRVNKNMQEKFNKMVNGEYLMYLNMKLRLKWLTEEAYF